MRPYPRRDRALHQLARGERRPTHRTWRTSTGSVAEEHVFPGQSFTIAVAAMAAHERVQERLAAQLAAAPQAVRALLQQASPSGAEFARVLQAWGSAGISTAEENTQHIRRPQWTI
jgi:hypothetical protein